MSRSPSLVPALAVLALVMGCGPALAQSEASRAKIGPSVDLPSVYGDFLAGQQAMRDGDGGKAAKLLIEAAMDRPDDLVLREHAFGAALIMGDIPTAARLAPKDDDQAQAFRGLGALTKAVDALADGRGAEADKLLSGPPVGFPNHAAMLLLKPYAAAQAGAWDRALGPHDAEGERLITLLDPVTRAQLLELRGRYAEAEALYKPLAEDSLTSGLFALGYGEFLERRGRGREAVALYEKTLALNPGDPGLIGARARAQGGGSPPSALDIRRAAAEALTYVSGSMAAQRQAELSLVYARLALRLDPNHGQAWVLCGDALGVGKEEAEARACWSQVKPGDRFYQEARTRMAYSLQRSGDTEAALTIARGLVHGDAIQRAPGEMVEADILRTANRYAEASQALDQVVAAGGDHDWRVLYMRAAMRQELGHWADAETDLKAALALAPDEPDLLNFLGYQWIDRGEDVKGGLAMIERAVKARPQSGAMQDSLGWAHYRLGDYPKAVESLETAVLLEPSDPAINDHLGDAYWMVGRKDEAGFQWRRALSFSPDAALKTAIDAKLKDGLGPKSQVAKQ